MPTPFMHLRAAELMRGHVQATPVARQLVADQWPSFLNGIIAPDFQTLFDIPREETHFYSLPSAEKRPPHHKILTQYPALARPERLPAAQVAFLSGYLAHLLQDWRWYQQVLTPYFVNGSAWNSHRQRFVAHTSLLIYLDNRALSDLSTELADHLEMASPGDWLPFAEREQLSSWGSYISGQLAPDAEVKTLAIFAARLGMQEDEMSALLRDPAWMQTNLFSRIPVEAVEELLSEAVLASIDHLNEYLAAVDK